MAAFEAEHQALLPRLEERFVEGEPARLLQSCDDFTRLCKVREFFALARPTLSPQIACVSAAPPVALDDH